MDGYTVDEAAEVLGIPGKRVWELIHTGVLAASSEGRSGMRVFLQPRTMTEMESTGSGAPRASDATPFRELLTEFRNLTERYGQALLALGEARGEVASLRGRVDLLEARIDVRHAPARIAPVGSWPSAPSFDDEQEAGLDEISGLAPPAAEQMVEHETTESAGAFGPEVSVAAPPPPEKTGRRSRRRGKTRSGHTTLADIPAALARAEDPNAAELRAAAEAEAAAERDRADTIPVEIAAEAAVPDEIALAAVGEPAEASLEAIAAPSKAEPIADEEPVSDDRAAVLREEWSEPKQVAPEAIAIPPQAEQLADEEGRPSDDRAVMPEEEPSEPEAPLFDEASPYTTAFEEPDWIIEEDLWRSVVDAGTPQPGADGDGEPARAGTSAADLTPSASEDEPFSVAEDEGPATESSALADVAEPEVADPTWASAPAPEAAAEPSTAESEEEPEPSTTAEQLEAEPEPEATVEQLEPEPEPSTTAEAEAVAETPTAEPEAEPEPSAPAEADGRPESRAVEAISAEVAPSIGEPEPEAALLDEAEPVEEAPEPIGDLDSFMAAAGFGSQPSMEPDYAAELEHSTAGWHSVIAPPDVQSDVQDPAALVEPEEPPAQTEESPAQTKESATAEPEGSSSPPAEPGDSAAENWDASEMEAIRALLARANAIDREQLEVEASSHPLEPDQEESVREIVASGAVTDVDGAVAEPAAETPQLQDEELTADLASPETAAPEEPPFSLSPRLELPGSDDLDEAMAALDAIGAEEKSEDQASNSAATSRAAPRWPEAERRALSGASPAPLTAQVPPIEPDQPSEPTPTSGRPGEEVLAHLDFGPLALNPPTPMRGRSESASPSSPHADDDEDDEYVDNDEEWLEPQDSAASRAFRRLRRIFPG
ncbi:MAG: hypothetical protein M3R49_08465 [Chloroflexota bacterium]|nr:hypothetical protein [Chloroflexota bacterium]